MRVLILGGSGMLGHKLLQVFAPRFDTYATFHRATAVHNHPAIAQSHVVKPVSAEDFKTVEKAFQIAQPNVVVNCVGIIKQNLAAKDPVASITVNSLFPHRLARLSEKNDARLIHLSTDCVFSGSKGNYSEADIPDATDLYGRSKLLGELEALNCLTIRTSMIGRELERSDGLLEWFLSQKGKRVRGFKRAVFSGLTTNALADVLADVVSNHANLSGLRHLAADAINKYDLLSLINEVYELGIEIEPDEAFVCDRSLDGSRFRDETGISAPSWPDMIARMHADDTPYDELRRNNAAR